MTGKADQSKQALEARRQRLEDRVLQLEEEISAARGDASLLSALGTARAELAEVLGALRALEPDDHDPQVVEVGDTVTVRESGDRREEAFTIVGPVEARLDDSWISAESPLGASLLGRRSGETVSVEAPGGTLQYRVLRIDRT